MTGGDVYSCVHVCLAHDLIKVSRPDQLLDSTTLEKLPLMKRGFHVCDVWCVCTLVHLKLHFIVLKFPGLTSC